MAPSYDKTMATAASLATSLMLVRSLASELLPSEVRDAISSVLAGLRSRMTWQHTIVVEETEGWCGNRVYGAVKAYLATRTSANPSMQRLRVSSADGEGPDSKMVVSMEAGEEMADVYDGTEFRWCLVTREIKGNPTEFRSYEREIRSYELSFHKRHKEKALKEYLPFIVATAKAIKDQERSLEIYMNDPYDECWSPAYLQHPSTFDTLAMDMKQKRAIVDDLNRFIKRKDYYRRIGKAWKRGYLLYGPPGTGKSSLIAAIANHLRFDIYDLELTGVDSNSKLRMLLVGMTNRSILVVEDIDCTIKLKQREEEDNDHSKPSSDEKKKAENKVTLSGLLNFVDGLWSTSGEERIIIFTTNYKERLDRHFYSLAGWTCTSTWGTAPWRLSGSLPITTLRESRKVPTANYCADGQRSLPLAHGPSPARQELGRRQRITYPDGHRRHRIAVGTASTGVGPLVQDVTARNAV